MVCTRKTFSFARHSPYSQLRQGLYTGRRYSWLEAEGRGTLRMTSCCPHLCVGAEELNAILLAHLSDRVAATLAEERLGGLGRNVADVRTVVRCSELTVAGSHSSLHTKRYRAFGRWRCLRGGVRASGLRCATQR